MSNLRVNVRVRVERDGPDCFCARRLVRESGRRNVEGAKRKGDLGLVSVQERIHLVHGMFSVESERGTGTTISASVPVVAAKQSSPLDETSMETAGMAEMG
jgi:hypothetical protein